MSLFNASDTIVLTGATGFTGRVVTRQLLAQIPAGCRLRIVARSSSDTREFEAHPQIEIIRGEVFEADAIERACDGCTHIIHMATTFRDKNIPEEQFRQVHVISTQLLAKAAARQPGFRRFVQVSSVGVYGPIEVSRANEDYRFNPMDSYQRTKAEAEQWLQSFVSEHHLPLTILRPVAIMGPGDKRLLKVFRMATLPVTPIIGRNSGLYHLIHVEDLARCVIAATDPALPQAATYIIGNREPSSAREIIAETAAHLGCRVRYLRIPAWPLLLLAGLVEAICLPLRVEPPLRRRRVAFFTRDRAFDTSRMQATFGHLIKHDNRSGIEDTLTWYRQHKLL